MHFYLDRGAEWNQETRENPSRSVLRERQEGRGRGTCSRRSGKPIFSSRSLARLRAYFAPVLPGRRRAHFHWRTKVTRSPCHGGIRRAARRPWDSTWYRGRPSPDGRTGDEAKRGTNAHTSPDRSSESTIDSKHTVGFATRRCLQKGF